jgi:hypothetical protein
MIDRRRIEVGNLPSPRAMPISSEITLLEIE